MKTRRLQTTCQMLLLASALFFVGCVARKSSFDIQSDDPFIEIVQPFGAFNGSVWLHASCSSQSDSGKTFHIALFSREEWLEIQQYRRKVPSLCLFPSTLRFEFNSKLDSGAPLTKLTQYHTAVLNCATRKLHCKGEATFLGEDGEQLSLDEQPLVGISALFFFAYVLCIIIWGTYYVHLRRCDIQVVYGRLLAFLFILKVVAEGLALFYLLYYSITGDAAYGLSTLKNVAQLLGELLLVLIILSASMGWGINRQSLSIKERQIFWGSFIAFAIFAALNGLCEEPRTLCFAYLLSFQVMRVLLTFGCGLGVAFNMAQLYSQLSDRREPNHRPYVFSRLKFLSGLRGLVPFSLIGPIAFLALGYTLLSWMRGPAFMTFFAQLFEFATANMITLSFARISKVAPPS